jgi:regulator of protease activity HflC (stomatin/prohibitin superfamily)
MEMSGLVFLAIFVAILAGILSSAVKRVPPGSVWMVERFGRFGRALKPGLQVVLPFVDRIGAKVDLGETTTDIPPQRVATRDGAVVEMRGTVAYRIVDAVKSAYAVADVGTAVATLSATAARRVVGSWPGAAPSADRTALNAAVLKEIEAGALSLGVKVVRIDLK